MPENFHINNYIDVRHYYYAYNVTFT